MGTIYAPAGAEFVVNSTVAQSQVQPMVAALADGGFVVIWQTLDNAQLNDMGLYAQRFNAAGEAVGGEMTIDTPAGTSYDPVVASLDNGGFVIAWQHRSEAGDFDILAREYDASGMAVGGLLTIATGAGIDEIQPTLAGLAHGGFVAGWYSLDPAPDGSGAVGFQAQRYDDAGHPVGAVLTVGGGGEPVAAGLTDGGFVLAWMAANPVSNSYGIYAQRFDASGAAVGAPFLVSPAEAFQEVFPAVAGLADGGFVITWYSGFDEFFGHGIYAQRYDAAGNPAGGLFQTFDQRYPQVTGLADDGFVIAWDTVLDGGTQIGGTDGLPGFDVFARVYDSHNAVAGGDLLVHAPRAGDQLSPSVAGLVGGGFVAAWTSEGQDGDGMAIVARIFKPATPGSGPDSLVLRVSEQAYRGDAQFTVSVDGVQQGGIYTARSTFGAGSDTLVLKGDWAPGGHIITVAFLNDAYGGSLDMDRNLFVEGLAYNGEEFLAGPVGLFSNGPRSFNFADIGNPTIPPTGPDTLVVQVSEQAYQGHAEFTISLDGIQQGGVYTASTPFGTGRDTVRLTGDFGPGPHTIAVTFINDAYGGAPDLDRNLFVEDVIFNGIDRLANTIGLFSNGTATVIA